MDKDKLESDEIIIGPGLTLRISTLGVPVDVELWRLVDTITEMARSNLQDRHGQFRRTKFAEPLVIERAVQGGEREYRLCITLTPKTVSKKGVRRLYASSIIGLALDEAEKPVREFDRANFKQPPVPVALAVLMNQFDIGELLPE